MADEGQGVEPTEPLAEEPSAEAEKPAVSASSDLPEGMVRDSEGKVQVLSSSAFKRLKEEAATRGAKQAQAQVEAILKAAGFGTLEDALAAARLAKAEAEAMKARQAVKPEGEEPKAEEKPKASAKETERLAKEAEQLRKQLAEYQRRTRFEERKRREMQRTIDAKEAEMSIREAAVRAGIQDVDYAVTLVERNLQSKPDEELEKFNEFEFFKGLKDSHPYLFGETRKAANTGNSPSAQGNPPPAGAAAKAEAEAGQMDATKLSKSEFLAYLRKKGLSF